MMSPTLSTSASSIAAVVTAAFLVILGSSNVLRVQSFTTSLPLSMTNINNNVVPSRIIVSSVHPRQHSQHRLRRHGGLHIRESRAGFSSGSLFMNPRNDDDDDDDFQEEMHDAQEMLCSSSTPSSPSIMPPSTSTSSSPSSSSIVMTNRRSFLVASAAALSLFPLALVSSSSSALAAESNNLEELSLGIAKWNDPNTNSNSDDATAPSSTASSSNNNNKENKENNYSNTNNPTISAQFARTAVPPSFSTYLARFLLRYDDGASTWWTSLSSSYSLLNAYEARSREGKDFGSFAYSMQEGLYQFVVGVVDSSYDGSSGGSTNYDDNNDNKQQQQQQQQPTTTYSESMIKDKYVALIHMFIDKYGTKEDALRNIGLLFSMLPKEYQPVDVMKKYCGEEDIGKKSVDKQQRRSNGASDKNNISNSSSSNSSISSSSSKKSQLPLNFQQEYTVMLPKKYKPTYMKSTNSFGISPSLELSNIANDNITNDKSSSTTTTTTTTIFGPLSSSPLIRQRPNLSYDFYALLGISGGAGCALTHTFVIPLDVVKTRIQTNPAEYKNGNILEGAMSISQKEGMGALLLGMQATIVGYLWYGISVYPSYAFFKHFIGESVLSPAVAMAHANDVALVAGAMASVIASLGLTPVEACRIRVVAQPEIYRDMGLWGTMGVIGGEDEALGWKNLYAGLPSLMTRQVIFGSVKFLAFERASEAIFGVWPELRDATFTALGVSLVAGGFSGVLSSVVSQPADSVLTYVAKRTAGGNVGVLDGARIMVQEEGVGSLFRGLGSRCVWAGCIIAGQFLLYDVFRELFGIAGDDLNQVFEVALSIDG